MGKAFLSEGQDVMPGTRNIEDFFGWEIEDMDFAEAVRAIEPLCVLWCIPGFIHNH